MVLDYLWSGGETYVLAGGVNNEYDRGMLAVIRDGQLSASTPTGSKAEYRCENCPDGNPYRYLIFPRSELSVAAHAPANMVRSISVLEDTVQVRTAEIGADGSRPRADRIYEFSNDLELTGISSSTLYWNLHTIMESEAKINHTAELCPERKIPVRVPVWEPSTVKEVRLVAR